MKNIYILWASIRPDFVLETSQKWIGNCVHKDRLHFKIVMATEDQKRIVEDFKIPNCETIAVTDKPGYTHAITQLSLGLELEDDDVLIFLTDDFTCMPRWDEFIDGKFENFNDAVFLNDGCQDVYRRDYACITLGCMTFACLKKINRVVFSPNYYHFFSDTEAYFNLIQLGLLKDDRATDYYIFKHEHHSSGARKSDQFDTIAVEHWTQDETTYHKRINMSVQERLATILGDSITPSDFNELIARITSEVQILSNQLEECSNLYNLTKEVANLEGDIVEIGVYQGGTAKVLIEAAKSKTVHLFDTFEGIPFVDTIDLLSSFNIGDFKCGLEQVKNYLKEYSNVKYYKGIFPDDTASQIQVDKFALVNIDVDVKKSIYDCLVYFYPKVVKGGYIIIHDYTNYKGVAEAVNTYMSDKPEYIISFATQAVIKKM
jgi:hypothetical protein